MIFRCRCRHLRWLHMTGDTEIDRESDALRVTLENLRRLASETGMANRGSLLTRRSNPLDHLSPEDRKEFLNNVLVSRVRDTRLFREWIPSVHSNGVVWLKNSNSYYFSSFSIENHEGFQGGSHGHGYGFGG